MPRFDADAASRAGRARRGARAAGQPRSRDLPSDGRRLRRQGGDSPRVPVHRRRSDPAPTAGALGRGPERGADGGRARQGGRRRTRGRFRRRRPSTGDARSIRVGHWCVLERNRRVRRVHGRRVHGARALPPRRVRARRRRSRQPQGAAVAVPRRRDDHQPDAARGASRRRGAGARDRPDRAAPAQHSRGRPMADGVGRALRARQLADGVRARRRADRLRGIPRPAGGRAGGGAAARPGDLAVRRGGRARLRGRRRRATRHLA